MADLLLLFLWGLVVLSAFIGWGRMAARAAGAPAPDWGLAAGWGMAALAAVGGVLALAGLARPPALVVLVLAGVAVHAAGALRDKIALPRLSVAGWGLAALALAVVAARMAVVASYKGAVCFDDDVAYFTYVARLLQTGTLIEPFGLRRLSAYGGHSFLQAMVMMAGSENTGFLFDRGVAAVAGVGLIAGYLNGAGTSRAVAIAFAVLMTYFLPQHLGNSSSHVSGFVLMVTLFRTLHWLPLTAPLPRPRQLWLIGLVIAAAAALKATLIVAAGATAGVYWLLCCVKKGAVRRDYLTALAHIGVSGLAFLAPWMALLQRSSGTPLYPLLPGNHRAAFSETYSATLDAVDVLGLYVDFFTYPPVIVILLPLMLHLLRRGDAVGLALYLGALTTAVVTIATLTGDTLGNHHRFVAPVLNAAFAATVAGALGRLWRDSSGRESRPAMMRAGNAILCAAVLVAAPVSVYRDTGRLIAGLGETVMTPDRRRAYGAMQDAVPPDAPVFAVLDQPFALDYRRNTVFNVDFPGAVSPDPGMPFFQGPRALKEYLLGQSVAHVAFQDFGAPDACMYDRARWRLHVRLGLTQWGLMAKYHLDLMDNLDALKATEPVVHAGDGLFVVRLRAGSRDAPRGAAGAGPGR